MNWNFKIKTILTLAFIVVYSLPLKATIHYVQHGQNNIPPYLSWQDAADSIQSAINVCAPGDTVIVANGVYYENLVIDSMLTLIGSSMDSTVIDGRGIGDYTILVNVSDFFSIENFSIYGKGEEITNSIIIYAIGDSIEIKNSKISEAIVGILVSNNCLIKNTIIEKLEIGFAIVGASTISNSYLTNNIMTFETTDSRGIVVGAGNYYISNNIILFTGDITYEYGISIGAPRKVYIYNNLISGFGSNIYIDDPAEPVYIVNNVLTQRVRRGNSITASSDYVFVNNVVLKNNSNGLSGDWMITSDYNLFWDNVNNLSGITYGDSDIVADPMFVNDTIPIPDGNYDYHLQAHSPGINKGDPSIFDIDSTRSDIGLYGGPLGESYKYLNLAPRAPVNLSASISKLNNTITLSWNRNSEADTAYYNVYRDTTENFIISPAKLVGSPTDTFYTEPIPMGAESLYYKITAVDLDENESLPSEEIFIDIVSGISGEPITINDYRLYQNYPNPFNPSTKIGYRLKESGKVKLMVYDIKGELVSVLVNKEQNAGYYEVEFNTGIGSGGSDVGGHSGLSGISGLASGIYLYRIEVIGEGNIPRFSDMKKMILIK